MTPRCNCTIKTIVFSSVGCHEAANGLYSAVEYVRRMLPTFKPAEEEDRNMIEEIILPYLDRQLKAQTTRDPRREREQKMDELAREYHDTHDPGNPRRDFQTSPPVY